ISITCSPSNYNEGVVERELHSDCPIHQKVLYAGHCSSIYRESDLPSKNGKCARHNKEIDVYREIMDNMGYPKFLCFDSSFGAGLGSEDQIMISKLCGKFCLAVFGPLKILFGLLSNLIWGCTKFGLTESEFQVTAVIDETKMAVISLHTILTTLGSNFRF
ncbi:hypothetical protein ACJX0J_042219, partial [Zea mays]